MHTLQYPTNITPSPARLNKQRPLPPPRVESSELEAPALPRQSCTTTQALNDIIASAMHQQQDQHRLHHYTVGRGGVTIASIERVCVCVEVIVHYCYCIFI